MPAITVKYSHPDYAKDDEWVISSIQALLPSIKDSLLFMSKPLNKEVVRVSYILPGHGEVGQMWGLNVWSYGSKEEFAIDLCDDTWDVIGEVRIEGVPYDEAADDELREVIRKSLTETPKTSKELIEDVNKRMVGI